MLLSVFFDAAVAFMGRFAAERLIDGPYAELHVGDRTFALRERMHTLEERLDPAVFFRIHRSAIVRLDRVEALLRRAGGDYGVRLKDGTELSLSRARREELEKKMTSE